MSSTYTSRLRLVKQGDGDNPNTWGTVLNDGMISLVDDAIAGYTTVELGAAATVTLSAIDGAGDVPRNAFLELKSFIKNLKKDYLVNFVNVMINRRIKYGINIYK